MTRSRSAGTAVAGVAVLAFALVGAGPAAASSGLRAAALPPPPACATAVAVSTGKATTKPIPLPPPASSGGGARLAQPGLQVSLPPGVSRPPALRATAWIVADLSTGAVLASCNAHVPLAPASTLKILTALALHSRINPAQRYVAQPADARIDGTKVGLSPGSVYTVDQLWHGLLMGSGNDTANALATLAGGTATAAQLMTATARSLGAADTTVSNTSGLDARGQATSVYDLALFGRALLKDPALAALVRTKTYAFPGKGKVVGQKGRKTYQIQNHDLLLFHYPGATGIKNGYTTAAGASFVGSATRNGHSYVVALLRTDFDSWRLAGSLLSWAFAHGARAQPVGTLDASAVPAVTAPTSPPPAPTSAPATAATAPNAARAVAVPVRSTLQAVPPGARTAWLVAALLLALTGGAVVRRVVGRTAPRSSPSGSRRPRSRGAPAGRTAAAKRSASRPRAGSTTARRSSR